MKDSYLVHHEGGGTIQVFADSQEDAIEEYYEAITSIVGHQMRICSCYGEPKPLDRSKVNRPTKVELVRRLH